MSGKKFQELQSLKNGSYDCRIKVRVIRLWRGVSTTGEEFKGFNVILLDNKNQTIHAFVPSLYAYEHERKLRVGNVCIINNFTVQDYKITDKFRSLRNDKQLIFSKKTIIKDIEDTGSNILADWFDLYDHSDLTSLSQQNLYLADVVGIIKDHLPFTKFKNKHGKEQGQAKFTITDGSSTVTVTFWDKFGEIFEQKMMEVLDKPVIVIIASCRVGLWNDKVNLSNVAATKFFLNYRHHSVIHLRKMLTVPGFKEQVMATNNKRKPPLLKLQDVLTLGKDFIDTECITHVQIMKLEEEVKWNYKACTSCWQQVDKHEQQYICTKCNRQVPYPDVKFKVAVVASDGTETIGIILEDREVRTIIQKRARCIIHENQAESIVPLLRKELCDKDYTIQLSLTEANIVHKIKVFWATNICKGFQKQMQENTHLSDPMQQSTSKEMNATSYMDGMEDNVNQETQVTKKGKEVQVAENTL